MMKYLQRCPKNAKYVKTSKDMSKIGTLIPAGGKPKAQQGLLRKIISGPRVPKGPKGPKGPRVPKGPKGSKIQIFKGQGSQKGPKGSKIQKYYNKVQGSQSCLLYTSPSPRD